MVETPLCCGSFSCVAVIQNVTAQSAVTSFRFASGIVIAASDFLTLCASAWLWRSAISGDGTVAHDAMISIAPNVRIRFILLPNARLQRLRTRQGEQYVARRGCALI
jgi:hypothetical protein